MARRVTTDDLIAAVAAAGPTQRKPDGEGWLTTREVATQLGMSCYTANRRLHALEEDGKAEHVKCPGKTGSVVWYWRFK